MMKPLRKKHLLIWAILAILLPAGILMAWTAVPTSPIQYLLQPATVLPLPLLIRKSANTKYTVNIRSNADTSQLQLEWIRIMPLPSPTASIYATTGDYQIATAKLVGRIEARGNWYFPLDASFKTPADNINHFIVYDFIHQQVIDTINCKP